MPVAVMVINIVITAPIDSGGRAGDVSAQTTETVDDDIYHHMGTRLKFERKTENLGFCTKKRKGVAAGILMATPCTKSLGGEGRGHK